MGVPAATSFAHQSPLQQTVSYPGAVHSATTPGTPQQMYSVQTIEQPQTYPHDASGAMQYTQTYGSGGGLIGGVPQTLATPISHTQTGYVQNPAVPGTTYYGFNPDGTLHCGNTPPGGAPMQGTVYVSPSVPTMPTGQVHHRSRTPPTMANPVAANGQYLAYTFSTTAGTNTATNIITAAPNMIRPGVVPHQIPTSSGAIPITPNYYPTVRPTTRTTPPPPQPILPSQMHPQSPVQYLPSSTCSSPSLVSNTGTLAGGATYFQPTGGEQIIHPTQMPAAGVQQMPSNQVLPVGELVR